MATFTWDVYSNTPGWWDISGNTLVYCSSLTDLTAPVTVGSWNDGAHVGDGDPGADQCGTNHVPNTKFTSSTEVSIDGAGATELVDGNIADTECSFRVHFDDASAVATSSGRLYTYDGATETDFAVGIEVYAWERGVTRAGGWVFINDASTSHGGDNAGDRMDLTDQGAGTEHTFYFVTSVSPESVGAKTEFDYGVALTYS